MRVRSSTRKRNKKILLSVIILILLAIGVYYIGDYYIQYINNEKSLALAKENVGVMEKDIPEILVEKDELSTEPLEKFKDNLAQNPDFVGWISIPNTTIDFPVVQTSDNDFYLKNNFERKLNVNGAIFMDFRNVINPYLSDNLLIYGHNMRNGSMFAGLHKYEDIEFYKKNPIIVFDSLYQENKYKIISVFETIVDPKKGEVFEYYNFLKSKSPKDKNWYIGEVTKRALYSVDVEVGEEDTFLTLQTCTQGQASIRFCVVARRVRPNESLTVNVEAAKVNETVVK